MGTTDRIQSARRAGPDDADALTTLRAVMLDAMAEGPAAAGDNAWHDATAAWFRVRLADRKHFAAYVVDDERGTVACAVGAVASGAPLPGELCRPTGQLFSVATDPRARRRGHARACVGAVLAWFDDLDVAHTDLSATPDGVRLYRSLGFVDRPWVPMRRPSPTGCD